MNLASNPSTSRERRLDEAIASFLAAIDAGAAPRADEWLAAHADLAPELESFLHQYLQVDELANPLRRAAESARVCPPDATHPDTFPPGQTPDPDLTTSGQVDPDAISVSVNDRAPASTLGDVGETGDGIDPDDDDPPLPANDRVRYFGDYELLRELGRGGMGVVYKARQVSLNRPVALKMIRSGALSSEAELRRFRNEAEAVALLDHPRIVPIFEVGSFRDHRYYSMRLVAGPSLADRLDAHRGQYTAIARLVADVAEAINHAHCRGVLHRDLKPANVLIDEHGAAHVTDFGLAKRLEGDSELTHTGAILGTPAYMAPEQASGRRGAITTATDVYGMGAILYALLTGHAPFEGEGVAETLDMVRNQPPEPPRAADSRIPPDLEVICLKCLEKEPSRRYATAAALAEDLRRFAAGEPIAARPVGALERAWLWCRRNRTVATLGALFVTALVIGTIVSATFAFLAHREAVSAKRERDQSEGLRYVAEINAAFRDLEGDAVQSFRRRLDELARDPSQAHRRGFEWHLLQALRSRELRVLRCGGHPVQSVAFSPDGRQLATAGPLGPVRLWDVATGQELAVLRELRRAESVAFSPDGRRLAGWMMSPNREIHEYTAKLWDTGPEHRLTFLGGFEHEVYSLCFAPDGRNLATTGSDGTLRLWDSTTGRELARIRASERGLFSVAFAPGGRRLAAGGQDGLIRVWDPGKGRELITLRGHDVPIRAVAFAPGGRRLVSSDTAGISKLWDIENNREIITLRRSSGLAFSPDGGTLAVGVGSGVVELRDAVSGQSNLALRGSGNLTDIAFSPDGRRLATATDGGTVRLWNSAAGEELSVYSAHEGPVLSLAFSPDGRCLATAGVDGTVRIWDAPFDDSWTVLRGHNGLVEALAFAPDNRRLASGGDDGTLRIWDAELALEVLVVRGLKGPVSSVDFSPDGLRLATAENHETARIRDAETGQVLLTIPGSMRSLQCVKISPDGRSLVTAGRAGVVRFWDLATGHEQIALKGLKEDVWSVAFSYDGSRLAIAERSGKVRLWDVVTGLERPALPTSNGSSKSVSFAPDGLRLATAGFEGWARIWDLVTGREIFKLQCGRETVFDVAFAPDGRRLATAGDDGRVRLWDTATGRELATFRGGVPQRVLLSPNGRRLASSHNDGTIQLHDASPVDDDTRLRREAVGLVRFALREARSEVEVRRRIEEHVAVSEEARALARQQAVFFWRAEMRAKAQAVTESLFTKLLLREDVLAALHADRSLDPAVRAEALSLAEDWRESEKAIRDASRSIADEPGRRLSVYRHALRLAEAACRLRPDNFVNRFVLGVAQYRAGDTRQALASLRQALETYNKFMQRSRDPMTAHVFGPGRWGPGREDPDGPSWSGAILPPDFLAYQAMSLHRLGEPRKARAVLELLRKHFAASATSGNRRFWASDDSDFAHEARLREAEALILGPQVNLPEDVFTR